MSDLPRSATITGADIEAAIAAATPLVDPRLSEVDWDAVAVGIAGHVQGLVGLTADEYDALARLAASPGARHDVPDLEAIARRVEGLRELAQRQGTWGIEYGDDRFCAAVLAMLRPPVLVPRDEPTREDIEG